MQIPMSQMARKVLTNSHCVFPALRIRLEALFSLTSRLVGSQVTVANRENRLITKGRTGTDRKTSLFVR